MTRTEDAYFAMGCFWGAERLFWNQPGVVSTAVGYMGGTLENPTYEDVCTGQTGHAETVHVVFDTDSTSFEKLCKVFFENHDPTQLNRQGNDRGTQYRSAIFVQTAAQQDSASKMVQSMNCLTEEKMNASTVTVIDSGDHTFYPAEDYHQKYLKKNPFGYCNLRDNGLTCPLPSDNSSSLPG